MQKLYETYNGIADSDLPDARELQPIAHTTQLAQIEIVLNGNGSFRRASVIPKEQQETLIPCTEESSGRAGARPATHPLCDKLQYVAADFHAYGGVVTSGYSETPEAPHADYLASLGQWTAHDSTQPKLKAVLTYVTKGKVVGDLVKAGVLPVTAGDHPPQLMKEWNDADGERPGIFRLLSGEQAPENAFVRWRVEEPGVLGTGTWEDQALIQSWQSFYLSKQVSAPGLCLVTGELSAMAEQHPKKIRHSGDRAKLISSNDTSGFTFRGRFTDADQAAGVSFDVTQKAHNALRWLIGRQAFRNGDQVLLSWAIDGQPSPDPWANSMDLLAGGMPSAEPDLAEPVADVGDVGQDFARRLNRAISGYRAYLGDNADIIVMGLDSATPGRLAITFYREIKGSEFLKRIQAWHETVSWPQNFGKNLRFVGAPAPRDVAEVAYGRRLDDKLKKATVERLIPCIVDGQALPLDLVRSCVRRTFNRVGLEEWEWEKCLGVACAVFRGFHAERGYSMALEEDRNTRDYLYGRLLAVADHLERRALLVADEYRDTTASRLMQRFADRPYSTWRNIELALGPYKSRLRAKRGPFLGQMEKVLDHILSSFSNADATESFTNDRPLSGEFLLSYHCQRQTLRPKTDEAETTEPTVAATPE